MRLEGCTLRAIAAEIGCTHESVRQLLKRRPDPGPAERRVSDWSAGGFCLRLCDREEISRGLGAGETMTAIARRLAKSTSTISREVANNGGRVLYRAVAAHGAAYGRARRPKTPKLADADLAAQVSDWLAELWSPQEIAKRLRIEFPDEPMMWVSHETIYQSIYVQGRGELRRELARCLRSGRAQRRSGPAVVGRGKIPNMVMISDRPAEVADRAVPGHWEGDLIIGKNGHSAVGTLVERSTRYVMLLHLPHGRGATEVRETMAAATERLPQHLWRSITWDQGTEMSQHVRFSVETGVQVYFCEPHSPWMRGSNENTNGPAAPVHAQGHRSFRLQRRGPRQDRLLAQQPPSTDPRMDETIREACRAVALTG
jgi:IS30 family transposase